MSVQREIQSGVQNPTRKQAWSVVGIMLLSATTSALTPVVIAQVKKLVKRGK